MLSRVCGLWYDLLERRKISVRFAQNIGILLREFAKHPRRIQVFVGRFGRGVACDRFFSDLFHVAVCVATQIYISFRPVC